MKYFLVCLGIFTLFLSSCNAQVEVTVEASSHISVKKNDDRFIESKQVVGRFSQFIWGDYLYAIIKTEGEEEISFFIEDDENCFLTKNSQAKLTIEYEIVERYIDRAGGYYPINLIKNIRTEGIDLETWRKSVTATELKACRKKYSESQAIKLKTL
jgi:hypothetical protein